jgi:hypothetical protein
MSRAQAYEAGYFDGLQRRPIRRYLAHQDEYDEGRARGELDREEEGRIYRGEWTQAQQMQVT